MSVAQARSSILDELAEFFASRPDRSEILSFRPSAAAVNRAGELLEKQRCNSLSAAEQHELDQYEYSELLMRLVKSRLRG